MDGTRVTLVNYIPGTRFPAVSVTGKKCALRCAHCRGKHLEGMLSARSPRKLMDTARRIASTGGNGILISGGSNSSGRVPLRKFYGVIEKISDLGLSVNVHPGIIGKKDAEKLVDANVSRFSIDIHRNGKTVKEIFGLKPELYESTLDAILDAGGVPVPHLTMGFGRKDFTESAELVSSRGLKHAVLLSAVPTEKTCFEGYVLPPGHTAEAVEILRNRDIEPILGCMRDRRLKHIEREAIEGGVCKATNLSAETLIWAKTSGFKVVTEHSCCCMNVSSE